jgi:drug/metabolite transporter (DMT)-like permease
MEATVEQPGRMTESRLALGAAAVTVLLWSSAFVALRAAGRELSPGALTLGRLVVGAIVLGGMLLVRREGLPPRSAWPLAALCGLLWFGIYNVALAAAEQRVDAGTAAMLVNIGPILIALLAGAVLKEGFPRSLLTGCAVAFAGTVVIGLSTSGQANGSATGVLLCILAAVTYAGGVVAQKPVLGQASGLQVTWIACVTGTLACLPFAPQLIHELGDAPAGAIAWTAYLGAFSTAIAFTTWAYALRRTTAGRMGATTYLVPPIAIVLGAAILSETPPALALLGGLLCLAGVALTRRS